MSRRSVFRTCFITVVLVMLLSISAMANTWGPQLKAATSWQKIDVTNAPDNTMLHKLVVPSDGVMYFSGVEYSSYSDSVYGLSFSLLNSSYTPINRYGSSTTYVNGADQNSSSYYRVYALKKGIYYLRVTGTKNYRIIGKFKAVADQGKAKKKKGTNLKRGKVMTALFAAGERYSKAEWFKIKVTKSRKIKLTVFVYGDASYRVYLYGPKPYKKGDSGTYLTESNCGTITYGIRKGFSSKLKKLNKGTYYVKVVRTSNDTSGYCSLKWK